MKIQPFTRGKLLLTTSWLLAFSTGAAFADAQRDCEKLKGDQAITACTQAILENPNDAKFYSNRGWAFLNKNDLDHAIADYTQAIEIDPKSHHSYYSNRAHLFHQKGEFDRALSDFTRDIELSDEEARQIDPRHRGFAFQYDSRGEVYRDKGDKEHAIADYKKALELDPVDTVAFNELKKFGAKIIKAQSGWGYEVYKEPVFQ